MTYVLLLSHFSFLPVQAVPVTTKQLPFFLSKSCDFNLKMDVYKKMFSSVDNGNSGEITIDQLKDSIEKSAEKDFVLFMNEEISRLKSDNIKLESYQGL